MEDNDTDPYLQYIIEEYLLGLGHGELDMYDIIDGQHDHIEFAKITTSLVGIILLKDESVNGSFTYKLNTCPQFRLSSNPPPGQVDSCDSFSF